jgi:ornithine cyclodeaminase/alanine dehydrogenase-like protein (mu-crystallin family)
MTLLVDEARLREHVSMRACIDAVERAFAAAGRGHMELMPRRVVSAGAGARLHSLAAASDELGYAFSLTYSGTPAGADRAQVEGAFSLDDVCAELGSVVAGRTQWRCRPGERTLYASCGSAVEAFGAPVGALERVRQVDLPEVHFE